MNRYRHMRRNSLSAEDLSSIPPETALSLNPKTTKNSKTRNRSSKTCNRNLSYDRSYHRDYYNNNGPRHYQNFSTVRFNLIRNSSLFLTKYTDIGCLGGEIFKSLYTNLFQFNEVFGFLSSSKYHKNSNV